MRAEAHPSKHAHAAQAADVSWHALAPRRGTSCTRPDAEALPPGPAANPDGSRRGTFCKVARARAHAALLPANVGVRLRTRTRARDSACAARRGARAAASRTPRPRVAYVRTSQDINNPRPIERSWPDLYNPVRVLAVWLDPPAANCPAAAHRPTPARAPQDGHRWQVRQGVWAHPTPPTSRLLCRPPGASAGAVCTHRLLVRILSGSIRGARYPDFEFPVVRARSLLGPPSAVAAGCACGHRAAAGEARGQKFESVAPDFWIFRGFLPRLTSRLHLDMQD